MNRRNFLSLFSAGVAGIALEQAIPLGRVWSFPKKIVIASGNHFLTTEEYTREFHATLLRNLALVDRALVDYSYHSIRANGWHFPIIPAVPPELILQKTS